MVWDFLKTKKTAGEAGPSRRGARAESSYSRGYEGAAKARRLRTFQPSKSHVNVLLSQAGETMNARARYLVRNNGYATNAVEAFTSHAVGTGMRVAPTFELSAEDRKALLKLWKVWTKQADADGLADFNGLQRRVAREVYITGECFIRFRPRRASDGLAVPLQLQILPAEMLDITYNEVGVGGGSNFIRNGIEFDILGRRVAYHFWRQHPGEIQNPAQAGAERSRVPADEVIHVYDPVEAGQVRGVSKFAPAIVKLFTLDAYDDAELERKKTTALFAGFVRKVGEGDPFENDMDDEDDPGDGDGLLPLEPGLMQYLDEGEDITFAQPSDVGGSYEVFQYRTLLQISAALNIPYMYLSQDMLKANYSNMRSALVDFRRRVEAFQSNVLVFLMCSKIWERWLEVAHISGAISLPEYSSRRMEYAQAEWLPPKWEWVDPTKDVAAEVMQIDNKLKPRSRSLTERGYDPEQVDSEIADDMERESRLGLPPSPGQAKASAPDNGEDERSPDPEKEDADGD